MQIMTKAKDDLEQLHSATTDYNELTPEGKQRFGKKTGQPIAEARVGCS